MNQSPYSHPANVQQVAELVKHLFPSADTQVERVLSGISTYVYRIISGCQTYYLRILPETGSSFAPELTVLERLRQHDVNVPEVIYAEDCNDLFKRPVMIESEIKGLSLSKTWLTAAEFEVIAREAGRDLARINTLTVEGFGWIQPTQDRHAPLRGRWPTYRDFALEHRAADIAYLNQHVLRPQESRDLEYVLAEYDAWLDVEQGYLAHGDFDSTHIFQDQTRYTGVIDFGEVRGTCPWYDLAHFRIRDGAFPPYRIFKALECGYGEIMPFPAIYEQHLRFTSVMINIRALSRAFQTRLPDQYIWRQLAMLHEDLEFLS